MLDHVAIGVPSVDAALAVLCGRLGLREGRRGARVGTGRPIAFAHDDATGVKVPARARTALVAPRSLDWLVQVIAYDPGAPEAPAPGTGT